MSSSPSRSSGLGSLAQSARSKSLRQARRILIAIGILTIIANGVMIAIMRSQVQAAMDAEVKKLPPGTVVDQAKRQELEEAAVRAGNLVAAGALALGVLFVVFGIIINHFPVPVTVLSLVLYIGAAAVFGILEPTTLAQGLVIKIIVIVALAKAIQSAIAYEKERRASLEVEPVE